MTKRRVYLDHAATTPMDPKVKRAMESFWSKNFGNPSSIYTEGRDAKGAMILARAEIAKILGAMAEEIIFTSGGTESDNLAILGVAKHFAKSFLNYSFSPRLNSQAGFDTDSENKQFKKPHIITSKIEHHAVLNPCKELEKQGWEVTYIGVDKNGLVDPREVIRAIKPETILVSVMYANNEIGTIQPINEIGRAIKTYKRENKTDFPYFHTDACQAAGHLDLNVEKLGVDLLTINGSKIYGPKGVGVLYVGRSVGINPLMYGGEQEKSLRPGTENVPAIVGMAEALKIAQKSKDKEAKRLVGLRDYFIKKLISKIPNVYLNGDPVKRLPNNINISVLGVEGESLVLYLDEYGVAASTGSACSSMSLEPSHVITAINSDPLCAHGSLRFTMGKKTTKQELDYVIKILPEIAKKLRQFSAVKI